MSKEIDWSKAPEGATHYHPQINGYVEHWVKPDHFCTLGFEECGWKYNPDMISDRSVLISRSLAWNGEGLPPAGTVCEGQVKNGGNWQPYNILAVTSQYLVVLDDRGDETPIKHIYWEFRPVRTAEQIAAEEREEAVDAMTTLTPLLDKGWSRRVCTALYDAGYRKQVTK